jgi:hypothetical protein
MGPTPPIYPIPPLEDGPLCSRELLVRVRVSVAVLLILGCVPLLLFLPGDTFLMGYFAALAAAEAGWLIEPIFRVLTATAAASLHAVRHLKENHLVQIPGQGRVDETYR